MKFFDFSLWFVVWETFSSFFRQDTPGVCLTCFYCFLIRATTNLDVSDSFFEVLPHKFFRKLSLFFGKVIRVDAPWFDGRLLINHQIPLFFIKKKTRILYGRFLDVDFFLRLMWLNKQYDDLEYNSVLDFLMSEIPLVCFIVPFLLLYGGCIARIPA